MSSSNWTDPVSVALQLLSLLPLTEAQWDRACCRYILIWANCGWWGGITWTDMGILPLELTAMNCNEVPTLSERHVACVQVPIFPLRNVPPSNLNGCGGTTRCRRPPVFHQHPWALLGLSSTGVHPSPIQKDAPESWTWLITMTHSSDMFTCPRGGTSSQQV